MKNYKILFAGIFISCFFFAHTSFAQSDESNLELPKFGIGLHGEQYKISDAIHNYYSAYTSTVLFPINITQHFRLEPEIGMFWLHEKDEDENNLGVSSGLGIFGMFQRGKVNIYAGGRIIYNKANIQGTYSMNGESSTEKYNSLKVGPSFGFEYFLAKNFCIGGEMGLRYSYSKTLLEITDYEEESSSSSINFDSGLYIRLFF